MQGGALFLVEEVATSREDLIERHKIDLAFRQVGGLIQNDPTIPNLRFQRLHGRTLAQLALSARPMAEGRLGVDARTRQRIGRRWAWVAENYAASRRRARG